MNKMVKEALINSDFWGDLHRLVRNWDAAIIENHMDASKIFIGQWEIACSALKLITGEDWHFTRDDKYYGICTEDKEKYLIRYDR